MSDFLAAQRAIRGLLGLPEERFALGQFVGMISDEIDGMRAKGRSDAEIAAILAKATGQEVAAADLRRHYAPPEARHPGD